MVPGVGGNVLIFAKMAKILGANQPIYGLQARGLDGKEAPFTSINDMAAHYVEQILRVVPDGPYNIAGACTGGLIAFEMAQQLSARGRQSRLFMLDTWHPDSYFRYKHTWLNPAFIGTFLAIKIAKDLTALLRQPIRNWWPTIKRKSGVLGTLVKQTATDHIQEQDFQIQRLTQATLHAVARYRVKPFGGNIINIIASQRFVDSHTTDTRHRWQDLGKPDSAIYYVPAEDSGQLFVSPHVEAVAAHIETHLQKSSTTPDERASQMQRDYAA
jgi:thioesterase domain-containing protein